MRYQRVVPRDLFNEAKLLKCMGRVCLLIHDNVLHQLTVEDGGLGLSGFKVDLSDGGNLSISNLLVKQDGQVLNLVTTYNSKQNYPLMLIKEDYSEISVFEEDGELSKDFLSYLGE